ncbi:MAG: hypothetical protein RJB13_2051, partial [Pseudomonadota bacterium]
VVVSDVHLRQPEDERTNLFCKFLSELPTCDTLVLLGDIFDFINARQHFYFSYWKKVFSELGRLRDNGVRVIFIEGNHDYGFQYGTHPSVKACFDHCGDFWGKLEHGQLGQMLLLHSDDVVCPASYRLFRGVVKSRLFQWLVSPVPGATTQSIFSKVATASRKKDDERRLTSQYLTDCVDLLLSAQMPQLNCEPNMCVFGHIHVPLDDHRNDIHFVSTPDWFSAPSYLHFNEAGAIVRGWLTAKAPQPELFRFASESLVSLGVKQK